MAKIRYQFANTVSFTARKWLNRLTYVGGRGGWLYTRLSVQKGKRGWTGDVSLRIGDCGDSVSLDVDAETPKERDAAIRKCDILIREVTKLRTALGKIKYREVQEDDDE